MQAPLPAAGTGPLFVLRPLTVGTRTGTVGYNASWPFPRSVLVYADGLLFRQPGVRTWVPKDRIVRMVAGSGLVRVAWRIRDDEIATASAGYWRNLDQVIAQFEGVGYRLERVDRPYPLP